MSVGMSALEMATTDELIAELQGRCDVTVIGTRQPAEGTTDKFVYRFLHAGPSMGCWFVTARLTQLLLADIAPGEPK